MTRRQPPPVPWFRGRTVVLTEVGGKLCFRPIGAKYFVEPPGTFEQWVPADRVVVAVAEGSALGLQGDFYSTGADIVISPLDPDDAQQLERVLAERLGLPRVPRRVAASELEHLREWSFVIVEGLHLDQHEETPNFEGVRLLANDLEQNRRYRVVGYLTPPPPVEHDDLGLPIYGPGYWGAELRPLSITPL
jgi:hypothetical protein